MQSFCNQNIKILKFDKATIPFVSVFNGLRDTKGHKWTGSLCLF